MLENLCCPNIAMSGECLHLALAQRQHMTVGITLAEHWLKRNSTGQNYVVPMLKCQHWYNVGKLMLHQRWQYLQQWDENKRWPNIHLQPPLEGIEGCLERFCPAHPLSLFISGH